MARPRAWSKSETRKRLDIGQDKSRIRPGPDLDRHLDRPPQNGSIRMEHGRNVVDQDIGQHKSRIRPGPDLDRYLDRPPQSGSIRMTHGRFGQTSVFVQVPRGEKKIKIF